ncbi:MAG: acyl-CoA dehydrogenase family protein [Desulfobacterales bacterium]
MNYDFTSEQNILRESAHRLLAKKCSSQHVREMAEDERGFSIELWEQMVDLGWMSLLIPEQYEGSGVHFFDLSILLSEMGYYCLPGPFFSTVVSGGLALLEAGSDRQKETILPDISNGKCKVSLAWMEEEGTYSPEGIKLGARKKNGKFILTGNKLFVPDAHVSDMIICAARTSGDLKSITLFLVEKETRGVQVQLLNTMAGDKQCEILFDHVEIPEEKILGAIDSGWPTLKKVLLKSAVAKCAEMIGGAQRVMDLVVPYVKGRKQFGRPIGAFQAIQHHCADMLTCIETMKYLTYQAAWRIDKGLSFEKEAAICKAWASDSYRKLVALGHQVIGGVGFMEEYDLQLYFKAAKATEQLFGDADFYREQVAREMGL